MLIKSSVVGLFPIKFGNIIIYSDKANLIPTNSLSSSYFILGIMISIISSLLKYLQTFSNYYTLIILTAGKSLSTDSI